MDDSKDQNEGSEGSIVERAKDAIGNMFGGSGHDTMRETAAEDSAALGGSGTHGGGFATEVGNDSNASPRPYSQDEVGPDSSDRGFGSAPLDYSSEMGGGATDTGSAENFDESPEVRSAYDPTTDEPGDVNPLDHNSRS